MHNVGVIVGSLRRDSINRKLANALVKRAAGKLDCHFIEIGDLPLYNEDLWKPTPPPAVLRLKQEVRAADAILLVTPEYNRSIPPAVKNAIDWANRPFGDNAWVGKPAGLVGASPGAIGTAVAQAALKSLFSVVDARLMGQPEVYITWKDDLVDANGAFASEKTAAFIDKWIDHFVAWIDQHQALSS
jgi:chromate reductase, NAD(P)H dehydrogenase (quinone)